MQIGAFVVERRLGRGGMAEVFSGRHEGQGVEVAVKLMRVSDHEHAAALTTAFRREAERLAALDHPCIVTVLDAGSLPAPLVVDGAQFDAGTPYFVMERATRSLDATGRPLHWTEVVEVAHAVLDALAHAHARGFVHRDLKPGNILVHEEPLARSPIQLGDFGIAHALDNLAGDALRDGLVGTPGFMAPEQIRGAFRDLGPWTDLYALGVTLHVLLTGRSPFAARTPQELLVAQLATNTLPALPTSVEAPNALRELLFALTHVDPGRRLRRAADAARLLLGVGPRSSSAWRDRGGDIAIEPTLAALAGASFLARASTVLDVPRPSSAPSTSSSEPRIEEIPQTWRTPAPATPRLALIGAGLSLYGVRAIPLAGRKTERDVLWAALGATVRERRASLVHVRGTSGVGKTRLAQWLGYRAHELGVADVLVARHGPERGPLDGLRPAFVRHLGCIDLDESELGERLRARLGLDDPFDLAALVRYLAPAARPGVKAVSDAGSDLHALRLLLRIESSRRPLIVIVDDVQWADEAAAALGALLEEPMPVLFVVTEQQGAPSASSGALAAVAASGGRLVQLGPLTEEEHLNLVEELLRLEPSLARRIALRTAGSPLFAVALVGDWVRRGTLVVGPHGFELAQGARFDLPDDLHAVWLERGANVLGSEDPERDALLEIAAMLGVRVSLEEWTRAANLAGQGGANVEAMAGELVREGLLVRETETPVVLRFVHGLLRESLLRRARERGREGALASAVGRLLEDEARRDTAGAAERLARHYVAHPSLGDAHPWLLRAASERRTACEYAGALALLDEASALSPESVIDPRTAPASLLRSWTLRLRGDLPGALAAAEKVLAELDRPELAPFAAEAHLRRADVDVRVGRVDRACEDLELSRSGFAARGDWQGFGVATWVRAWIELFRGELAEPVDALAALRTRLEQPGAPPPGATHVLWALGYTQLARGDLDDAAATYAAAEETATRFHNRLGVAHVRAGKAQIARLRGRAEEARELAEASLELFRLLGASEAHFGELALGLALADLGRFAEAITVLDASADHLARTARSGF
ncbi:MAG: protein kinase domain-containing protein, partial [Polyangiales bacterium]